MTHNCAHDVDPELILIRPGHVMYESSMRQMYVGQVDDDVVWGHNGLWIMVLYAYMLMVCGAPLSLKIEVICTFEYNGERLAIPRIAVAIENWSYSLLLHLSCGDDAEADQ